MLNVLNRIVKNKELMNPGTQEGSYQFIVENTRTHEPKYARRVEKQIISQQARRWNFGQMD